jgi:acetoacetyl-CoA synthetase
MTTEAELLWSPAAERVERSSIMQFAAWLARQGRPVASYDELWRWSIDDLDGFWTAAAEWLPVRWTVPPQRALGDRMMPGAEWFPGGRLNYAGHLLFPDVDHHLDAPAVLFTREDGYRRIVTWAELRAEVGALQHWLQAQGVGPGDRVASLLPNCPQAVVAMLAATALGAIWSSCSPDFGLHGTTDRFSQIEPVVLFAVDGYFYGGREFGLTDRLGAVRDAIPTLRATVVVDYLGLGSTAGLPDNPSAPSVSSGTSEDGRVVSWAAATAAPGEVTVRAMEFAAPLVILYSSGTTGLPKPIVHSHGGILLEHLKELAFHLDVGTTDRLFWFTTTGWMMWNFMVSALALGSAIVLYDGNPAYPSADALWELAGHDEITVFGVSAAYLHACMKADLHPGRDHDLSGLRSVGSTGSPLSSEAFRWVYSRVAEDLMLSSLSGGTDVCSAFVGGAPILPVRAGVIPCRQLGCDVQAFDSAGHAITGDVGELVLASPMPSMPLMFWNDPDGSRLREAYFDVYPGVWRHGDWIRIAADGSCVIEGRSDATLNRGGVRMGTAEFYRVVEEIPGVDDSLIVDTSEDGVEGQLLLFVVLANGMELDSLLPTLRRKIRTELSPRHLPDEVRVIAEVPRTLNGKKCEIPVKRVLCGVPLASAVSAGALANPAAMAAFTSC